METTTVIGAPLRRRTDTALGVVLFVEALVSPLVWWGAFLAGTLFSASYHGAASDTSWLDAMRHLGGWGVVMLFAVLAGAAVVVLRRPTKGRPLAAIVCLVAGLLNAVAATGLVAYNTALSDGPIGPRSVGLAFGVAFASVTVLLLIEAVAMASRRPTDASTVPDPRA